MRRARRFATRRSRSPPDKALPDAPVRRLDRVESLLALGRLGLRMRMAPERIEPLFTDLLAASPNDARALAALAYLSAARDDDPRAREYLGKLDQPTSSPLPAEAASWAGDTHWRLAVPPENDAQGADTLDVAQMRRAKGFYRRALDVDAEHLGAIHGLARMCTLYGDRKSVV